MRSKSVHLVGVLLLVLVAACGGGGDSASRPGAGTSGPGGGEKVTLHLGFYPNVTHATAIVGVETGIFARSLGPNVTLQPATFNAGPSAIEALFSGAIDATYVGPNPAINGFIRSKGEALRVISGATSGGAYLVARPDISGPQDLRGKKIGSPQLGNTQDVTLRAWLRAQGLRTTAEGGGDVAVMPQENAQSLEAFRSGQIAGAWVPEPWASRLVLEGGGKVLVDERDLWPGGKYVTVHLVVRTDFLRDHPQVVERLLRGQVEANAYVNSQPAEAQRVVKTAIERITNSHIADDAFTASWRNLTFTNDPVAASLRKSATDAAALGFLQLGNLDLSQIYDLQLLNKVLKETGNAEVQLQ